jgi:hypothetical protein
MPAPPPKTAKEAAEPRVGAARAAVLAMLMFAPIGTLQAAKKAAIVRTPIPPRTFFVYVFIVVYLLV